MALYHKWYVKNGFVYVLIFFLIISDSLGSVRSIAWSSVILKKGKSLACLTKEFKDLY